MHRRHAPTPCIHCLIPGHTTEKCFQKAQGKPATTPAGALSRQAMYCALCHKRSSHEAATCFKRPGHMVGAFWATSSINTATTLPSTHKWAGMVTVSLFKPSGTTSTSSNTPLIVDSTFTSVPSTSTDRVVMLEELHSIQCDIPETNIEIQLKHEKLRLLETRLTEWLDALQAPTSAVHRRRNLRN